MAIDITNELNNIKSATYGEQVRGSIHDGIKKIADEVEASGSVVVRRALTEKVYSSDPSVQYNVGDYVMYPDADTGALYICQTATTGGQETFPGGKWLKVGLADEITDRVEYNNYRFDSANGPEILAGKSCDDLVKASVWFVNKVNDVSTLTDFPIDGPGWIRVTVTNQNRIMQEVYPSDIETYSYRLFRTKNQRTIDGVTATTWTDWYKVPLIPEDGHWGDSSMSVIGTGLNFDSDAAMDIALQIAEPFTDNVPYTAGDLVVKDNVLYKFTANHAAGTWTGNDVVNTSVADEMEDAKEKAGDNIKHLLAPVFSESTKYFAGQYAWINNELGKFIVDHEPGPVSIDETSSVDDSIGLDISNMARMFAWPYDSTSTYNEGDFCIVLNRYLYRCISTIDIPEEFTSAHWTRTYVTDVIINNETLLFSTVVTSDTELNRIIKRLYIPASLNIDISSVNRVTVYNGFSNLYGFRFFNKSNTRILEFAKTNDNRTGLITRSYCYCDLGDLSIINGQSKNYYCKVSPSVYLNTKLEDDFIESCNAKRTSIYGNFIPSAQALQGDNVGDKLRVMSYNVAHYNNDMSSVVIPAEKVHEIIKVFGENDADIVCVQEDSQYIDSNNVRTTAEYIYYPQYPYSIANTECTIKSKKQAANGTTGTVAYSNGRWLSYGVFNISNKKLLVCSTHPVSSYNGTGSESTDSVAARLTQYTELFKWVAGEIDLNSTHVPEHTHVVIGIDANSISSADKTNLINIANDYHYVAGNGGRLGWLNTAGSDSNQTVWLSIDNIIVSNNIIINSIKSLSDQYTNLYSDHVPLIADITLLDA